MLGLWNSDVDLDDLAGAPRWFIEGVIKGEPDELAAQRAGVTLADVRAWSTDKKFRLALKRARRGDYTAKVTLGDPVGSAPAVDEDGQPLVDYTATVGEDGEVEYRPNAVPAAQRIHTPGPADTFTLYAWDWNEYHARCLRGEQSDSVLREIRARYRPVCPPASLFAIEQNEETIT